MEDFYIIKILFFVTLAFIFTYAWTPLLTFFLYKYNIGKQIRDDKGKTPIFTKLHMHKKGTPTMGGILIWVTVLIFSFFFFYLGKLLPWDIFFVLLIDFLNLHHKVPQYSQAAC